MERFRMITATAKWWPRHAESNAKYVDVPVDFVHSECTTSILWRLAQPEKISNLVVYVCSPQASATTGAALRVDGGVVDTIA
ncbi:hypothetical protein BamMEX5DRAFT_2339 [Burkholderia ambifaria MEX-5]|uniref:Short-chain dehydrogenase/reductase SDR n=1 Tax=Burkholderia ambifaria MEX-5 TaxID=396597 RepID=B1T3H3_9BURK|nr:hypothetical protein BamMEX5DRAFT_2339 [Burkholderia ambifaria MEX-5]